MLGLGAPGYSQVSALYVFSQSMGTYTPLAGGTVVAQASGTTGAAALDDVNYTSVTIPFTFNFNGVPYTSLTINTNGYITFGSTTPSTTTYSPISATTGYAGAVVGFARDLRGIYASPGNTTTGSATLTNVSNAGGFKPGQTVSGTGIPSGTTVISVDSTAGTVELSAQATATGTGVTVTALAGMVKTGVEGTAPNRTFVIEWTGFQQYNTTNTLVNFQIRLNEGGGLPLGQSIDIVYGTVYGSTSSSTAQVGLRGATNADFNDRSGTTGWTNTDAGSSNSASVTYSNTIFPPSGLTYAFIPASCPAPYAVSTNTVTTGSAMLVFTSPGSATTWQVEYGQTGTPQGSGTVVTTNSNPYMIGGLTQNTNYTVYLRSICGPGDTSAPATITFTTLPTCPVPTSPTSTNITQTSADLNWTENGSATMWEIEYGPDNFVLGTGNRSITTVKPITLGGLSSSSAYSYFVRSVCSPGDSSNWSLRHSFSTTLTNDNAAGAVMLTVGAGCSGGNAFTNTGATQGAGEPFTNCKGTAGYKTVWFSFVAPASGFVKISNDYAGAGLGDSRMALYTAPDVNDYTSFIILACDDDNGVTSGTKSIIYANGLTQGVTYYVVVDGYSSSTSAGSFCLTVDEVSAAMLPGVGDCVSGQSLSGYQENYHGWVSFTDNAGNLIANMRTIGGTSTSATHSYDVYETVHAGAVRQSGLQYYLDRNYTINNATAPGPMEIQFYFLTSEATALETADPTAMLSNLNVTKQAGILCVADYLPANGVNSLLPQTANGSVNGVSWVETATNTLSNFYVHAGANPLVIQLTNLSAVNEGRKNRISWKTVTENMGDHFIIERSLDGNSFTSVGSVDSKGTPAEYSFVDETPIPGLNYYRLQMVDVNGRTSYSKVVTATMKPEGFAIAVYPNPAKDKITVRVFGESGNGAQAVLTDLSGKLIRSISVTAGQVDMDLTGLSSGVYLLKYTDGGHQQIVKVNKQ